MSAAHPTQWLTEYRGRWPFIRVNLVICRSPDKGLLSPLSGERQITKTIQIPPAVSPVILHHTVWRTWLFIACSDWEMIILPTPTYTFLFKCERVKGWMLKTSATILDKSVGTPALFRWKSPLFDFPLPPPPLSAVSVGWKCTFSEQHWPGGRGDVTLCKRVENRAIREHVSYFQAVPRAFVQDCRFPFVMVFHYSDQLLEDNPVFNCLFVLFVHSSINSSTNQSIHTRVLARPKRQGAVPCRFIQRPVVFPRRPVVFSAPCHFSRARWFLWAFISVILSLKLQKASY